MTKVQALHSLESYLVFEENILQVVTFEFDTVIGGESIKLTPLLVSLCPDSQDNYSNLQSEDAERKNISLIRYNISLHLDNCILRVM